MKVGKRNITACRQCPAFLFDDEDDEFYCGFGAFGAGQPTSTPGPVYTLNFVFYDCPILHLVYGGDTL